MIMSADKALVGAMSMKEVEASLQDLNNNWFIGSEADPRYQPHPTFSNLLFFYSKH
jgi:hypothetical protein